MDTHPAFPSLPPGIQQPSHPPPTSSKAVSDLIQSCDTLDTIHSLLVPYLDDLAAGIHIGGDKKRRSRNGEEILCLGDQDLGRLRDEVLHTRTAGFVYVISARLDERFSRYQNTDIFDLAVRFCNLADSEQLQLCSARAGKLAWGLLNLAKQLRQTRYALQTLRTLLQRTSRRATFTSVHAAYLEACLMERNYDEAQALITEVFLDFTSARPTYLDVLTYYHHAGLISAAVGDYAQARDFFVAAVSAPTSATSAIQVACAKRALLCELLVSGKLLVFPKYTSPGVMRSIERGDKDYQHLGRAFAAHEWEAVQRTGSSKAFEDDCNLGLVQAVLGSITKRRILRIKETYSRLSIAALTEKVGLGEDVDQVTAMLGDLIATRAVEATITPAPDVSQAIVTFHGLSIPEDPAQTLAQIKRVNAMANWLEAQLAGCSRGMGLHEQYLQKQAEIHNVSGKKAGGNGLMPGAGGGKAVEDFESMMMSEEFAVGGGGVGRVGADYNDAGY